MCDRLVREAKIRPDLIQSVNTDPVRDAFCCEGSGTSVTQVQHHHTAKICLLKDDDSDIDDPSLEFFVLGLVILSVWDYSPVYNTVIVACFLSNLLFSFLSRGIVPCVPSVFHSFFSPPLCLKDSFFLTLSVLLPAFVSIFGLIRWF